MRMRISLAVIFQSDLFSPVERVQNYTDTDESPEENPGTMGMRFLTPSIIGEE